MIDIRAARSRFESVQPGIRSRHSFAAGADYDPANTSFGSLIGVDEHRVEPAGGFAPHAHRGVDIVSWVLSGTLRHRDDSGPVRLVRPGALARQFAGAGVRHSELNDSPDEPLHFVQLTWLGSAGAPRYTVGRTAVDVGGGRLSVVRGPARRPGGLVHVYVVRGTAVVGGTELTAGDTLRADGPIDIDRADEILVWSAPGSGPVRGH